MKRIPPFLTGSSLHNLFRVLNEYRVEDGFRLKALFLFFWPAITALAAATESVLYSRRTSAVVVRPPVFIIGHWRSGTTYLHYLLANDPAFYAPTNFDVFVPGINLTGGWLARKILGFRLPSKRPMDNVALHPDLPQEEEFAIANLSPFSYYHGFAFPNELEKLFQRYVLLKMAVPAQWKEIYYRFIRKLQYKAGDKTLLLKNPVNTGRVHQLAEMFPGAKFIYLHRDPEEVKQSTYRMLKSLVDSNTLQSVKEHQLKMVVENTHHRLIAAYEAQRSCIPTSDLLEIDYAEWIEHPMEVAHKIYSYFNVDRFEQVRPEFERFVAAQKNFKTHSYTQPIEAI